jgi:hypothetical protein
VITPGVLLSGVSLPLWPAGAMLDLRSGHGPRALVTLHSADCSECRRYVRVDLASGPARLAEWGGHLVVVVPGQVESANELAKIVPDAMQVLTDPQGKLVSGKALVILADEWGEVYFVTDAEAGHDLPTLGEIRDWSASWPFNALSAKGRRVSGGLFDIQRS